MNNFAVLQAQSEDIRQLLRNAGDDPVLAPQLEERLQELEHSLSSATREAGLLLAPELPVPTSTAIFLRGQSVDGTLGIRPSLAGETMIEFERMFIEQAIWDERKVAESAGQKRRKRGSQTPELLLVDTPKGSFGMEFIPRQTKDVALNDLHSKSVRSLSNAICAVADPETSLEDVVSSSPPRLLEPMKRFFKALFNHRAELKIAFSDAPARTISFEAIVTAADRLERDLDASDLIMKGVFQGMTFESGHFDLVPEAGRTISGKVDENLADDQLDRIAGLLHKQVKARLQQTTVTQRSGSKSTTYTLLDAQPVEAG